jgi:hypothetical protein
MSFYLQSHRELTQVTTYQDTTLGIMKWGFSNSYPQTMVNFIGQSATAYPSVNRTADFYKGQGFKGEDTIVAPNGITARQVVSTMADDYAVFKAFALHGNYNMNNLVSSIMPMRIPNLRFNEFDELNYASKVGYHPNFGLNAVEKKMIIDMPTRGNIKWFNRFNPDPKIIKAQIEKEASDKLGNYNGQILYHSDSGHSSYPIPPLQAPINFVLSDIDNSILIRKETSTGFVNTYILKTTLSAESPVLQRLEEEIYLSQGARGSGRVITYSDLTPEEVSSQVLEELGSGGSSSKATIESAILTYELNQKVITGAYLIPPILAGIGIQNGFTGVDLGDAYNVFNALTQPGRDIIEQQFNRILKHSVFKDKMDPIKIIPLNMNPARDANGNPQGSPITETTDPVDPVNRNPLTGRQEQSLQRIIRNYGKEKLTRDQAVDQLRNDLGFDDARIATWLGEEPKI